MMRLMDKVIDRQDRDAGTFLALNDVEKRVRIEVTLQKSVLHGLGVKTLQDLKGFKFNKLHGDHFQFFLPTIQKAHTGRLPRQAFSFLNQAQSADRRAIRGEETAKPDLPMYILDHLDRLKNARLKLAELVLMDRVYLPIFERIENDIAALEAEDSALDRARALLTYKATA